MFVSVMHGATIQDKEGQHLWRKVCSNMNEGNLLDAILNFIPHCTIVNGTNEAQMSTPTLCGSHEMYGLQAITLYNMSEQSSNKCTSHKANSLPPLLMVILRSMSMIKALKVWPLTNCPNQRVVIHIAIRHMQHALITNAIENGMLTIHMCAFVDIKCNMI